MENKKLPTTVVSLNGSGLVFPKEKPQVAKIILYLLKLVLNRRHLG